MPFLPDPSLLDAAPDEAYPYDLVDVRGQEHQKMLPLHGHAQRLSIREHRWMTAGAARALGPRGLPGSPARFPGSLKTRRAFNRRAQPRRASTGRPYKAPATKATGVAYVEMVSVTVEMVARDVAGNLVQA